MVFQHHTNSISVIDADLKVRFWNAIEFIYLLIERENCDLIYPIVYN